MNRKSNMVRYNWYKKFRGKYDLYPISYCKNICSIDRLRVLASGIYRNPRSVSAFSYNFYGGSIYKSYKIRMRVSGTYASIINKSEELDWIDDLEYTLYELLLEEYGASDLFGKYKAVLQMKYTRYPDTPDSHGEHNMDMKLFKVYKID